MNKIYYHPASQPLYPPLADGDTCPACSQGKVQRRGGSIVECPSCKQRFALQPPHVLDEQTHVQRVQQSQKDEIWSHRVVTLFKDHFVKVKG